jgi:hypothetical protein
LSSRVGLRVRSLSSASPSIPRKMYSIRLPDASAQCLESQLYGFRVPALGGPPASSSESSRRREGKEAGVPSSAAETRASASGHSMPEPKGADGSGISGVLPGMVRPSGRPLVHSDLDACSRFVLARRLLQRNVEFGLPSSSEMEH